MLCSSLEYCYNMMQAQYHLEIKQTNFCFVPYCSSAFPAISLGFTILGEIFAYVTFFFFFFFFFESVRWNACVHRLDLGVHSHPKEFLGNGVRTHVNSKGKFLSTGKILLRRETNPRCCIKQDSEPNTLLTRYSSPHVCISVRFKSLF